jgi:hypothetical protein
MSLDDHQCHDIHIMFHESESFGSKLISVTYLTGIMLVKWTETTQLPPCRLYIYSLSGNCTRK